jgi:type IV pilus assembly protein PilN
MAKINLLPWREELRKQRQQDFLIALGVSVLLTCILFGLVYLHIEGMKEYQQKRNDMVQLEIDEVKKIIKEIDNIESKKNTLNTKIDLIKNLQASRPKIVRVFDELRRITPIGVYLLSVDQKGGDITITGKAETNAKVSDYMKAVENSKWLTSPNLKFVKGFGLQEVKGQLKEFTLQVKQPEEKKEEKKADKAADTKPAQTTGAK